MLRAVLSSTLLLLAACEPVEHAASDEQDDSVDSVERHETLDASHHEVSLVEAYRLGIINDDHVPYEHLIAGEDSDGDGLYDAFEIGEGLDPLNPDTDGDGVNDHWDLLGSEPIDPRFSGGGFAWFDPSKTEYPDMGEVENRARRMYGLYFFPNEPMNVIAFGSNPDAPIGFRCHNLELCNLYEHVDGWSNYDATLLNVVLYDEGEEHRVSWNIIQFRDGYTSREGLHPVARAKQTLTLQTAPVHSSPLPHWGPDPDADGLSFDAERELGTNPLRWDTDFDGIPDGAENNHDLDPTSSDTDNDGTPDLEQVLTQTEIQYTRYWR